MFLGQRSNSKKSKNIEKTAYRRVAQKMHNFASGVANHTFLDSPYIDLVYKQERFKCIYVLYIYIYTRLLGRFAPIFYLNCEHVLNVTLKNKEKKFVDFIKKICEFSRF